MTVFAFSLLGIVMTAAVASGSGAEALTNTKPVRVGQADAVSIASPDGKWSLSSRPFTRRLRNAALILRNADNASQVQLCTYFRDGFVIWTPDSRAIVFLDDHSVQETRLRLYVLDQSAVHEIGEADAQIRTLTNQLIGSKNEALFRNLSFNGFMPDGRLSIRCNVRYIKKGQFGPASEKQLLFAIRAEDGGTVLTAGGR